MTLEDWRPAAPADADWLAPTAELRVSLEELAAALPAFAWVEVLHPAYRLLPGGDVVEVTWDEVAVAHGSRSSTGIHFDALVGMQQSSFENGVDDPGSVWNLPPTQGALPPALDHRLLALLSADTDAIVGSVGVWEGWAVAAGLRGGPAPRVLAFGRSHLLFQAPLEALSCSVDAADHQPANVRWPADRRWVVTTDPDHWSTFVGGSRKLVDRLRASAGIEARPS